ncbi:MAG: NDP-sugar synthase [Vicinamibacteraceae bacterium]
MSVDPSPAAWPPDALLLTAGVGSRLHPLTLSRAKPAVPLAGVPLITRILRGLSTAGVTRVVLNLHHRPETIARIAGDGADCGLTLRYSWEQTVLGSGGGPRHALPLLAGDPYLLLNGDTLATVDLRALWDHHHAHDALVTMALIPNPEPHRFGGVLVDADGWITGFCRRGDPRPNFHFFSAQVVARSVFADLPDGVYQESVGGIYPRMLADTPRRVRAFVCDAPFIEVGTPGDYRLVHIRLAAEDGVSPWTPGARATIDPTARLDSTILWDDVAIGPGAVLERCVVADRTCVPNGLHVADACLVPWPDGYVLRPGERREADVLIVPDAP